MLQFLKICHYPCHLRGEMERPLYSWTCWCSPASLSSLIIPNFFYFLFTPGPRWIIYCTYNITLDLVHAVPSLSFEKKINAWRSSYFIYLYFLKFEIFTCVYTYMCATVLLWRSLDNFGDWWSTSTFMRFSRHSGARLALFFGHWVILFTFKPLPLASCSLSLS